MCRQNYPKSLGGTKKHLKRCALRSKSLLGCARQPLGARNHMFRSHLALEIVALAGFFVFDGTRKHCPRDVFSHIPLEFIARACSAATKRSKSLLGRASKPLTFSGRNRCSSRLLCMRQHSKTPPSLLLRTFRSTSVLGRVSKPFSARTSFY